MKFTSALLNGVYTVEMQPIGDTRGWFGRAYCKNEFKQIGHSAEWVQINHSFSGVKGTVRGMHFQEHPYGEIKLVRCIAGAVYDVVIDIRAGSPTFLRWMGVELSAAAKNMIYIPEGFAHGFQSMTDNAELIYHHSNFYTAEAEKGIRYDDELVGIKWPLAITEVSARDRAHESLTENFKGI